MQRDSNGRTSSATSNGLWTVQNRAEHPPLTQSIETDVLVVGGGVAALTLALTLADDGRDTVVIDAGSIASHAQRALIGHAGDMLDVRYATLEMRSSEEATFAVAASLRAAREEIVARVAALGLACDLTPAPAFLFTEQKDGLDALMAEYAAAQRAGVKVTRDVVVPLPFTIAGGIRFEDHVQLALGPYLRGIAAAAAMRGVRMFEHTTVTSVRAGEPCTVELATGARVLAKLVVFAVRGAPGMLLDSQLDVARACHVAYTEAHVKPGLYRDMADPHHVIEAGVADGQEILVVRGEEAMADEQEPLGSRIDGLAEYARMRFGASTPDGKMAEPIVCPFEGLPLVGRSRLGDEVFVVTGLGDQELVFGTVAARLVADTIAGRECSWSSLYAAERLAEDAVGIESTATRPSSPL